MFYAFLLWIFFIVRGSGCAYALTVCCFVCIVDGVYAFSTWGAQSYVMFCFRLKNLWLSFFLFMVFIM